MLRPSTAGHSVDTKSSENFKVFTIEIKADRPTIDLKRSVIAINMG